MMRMVRPHGTAAHAAVHSNISGVPHLSPRTPLFVRAGRRRSPPGTRVRGPGVRLSLLSSPEEVSSQLGLVQDPVQALLSM